MDKELEITTSLDQAIRVEHQDILDEVEHGITEAVQSKDVDLAFHFCQRMIGEMKRSGIGLAKALWMINKNWALFGIGDDFEPTAQYHLGLHPHTIERYVKVWEMLTNYVPLDLKGEIQNKNIRSLIPIANAVAGGYEIEEDTWEKLADAPDFTEISKIVREEVTKKPARRNNLTLKMDKDGSLWAYTNSGVFFVGSLETKDSNEFVRKAVDRIVVNSGILRG